MKRGENKKDMHKDRQLLDLLAQGQTFNLLLQNH